MEDGLPSCGGAEAGQRRAVAEEAGANQAQSSGTRNQPQTSVCLARQG